MLWIHFIASNNAAEYEAAIHGLRIAKSLGITRLIIYGDSALVVHQASGDWDCNSDNMGAYCKVLRKLAGGFRGIEFQHIVRSKNEHADKLSKIGSARSAVPPGVFIEDLRLPSIMEEEDKVPLGQTNRSWPYLTSRLIGGLPSSSTSLWETSRPTRPKLLSSYDIVRAIRSSTASSTAATLGRQYSRSVSQPRKDDASYRRPTRECVETMLHPELW